MVWSAMSSTSPVRRPTTMPFVWSLSTTSVLCWCAVKGVVVIQSCFWGLRKLLAICIVCELWLVVRWVLSELKYADPGSRVWEVEQPFWPLPLRHLLSPARRRHGPRQLCVRSRGEGHQERPQLGQGSVGTGHRVVGTPLLGLKCIAVLALPRGTTLVCGPQLTNRRRLHSLRPPVVHPLIVWRLPLERGKAD